MTDTVEEVTPLYKMLTECGGDAVLLGERISAVLEFLTIRAVSDAPYMILTDDEDAMVLFAAGDAVQTIRDAIPEDLLVKHWEEDMDEPVMPAEFLTNADPGDEQLTPDDTDEPTAEQE